MGNLLWRMRRSSAMAITFGCDVVFPWLRADQVDHLHYSNLERELPIRDVVPLHHTTHAVVTELRKRGHRKAVNAALRAAAIVWLIAEVAVFVALLVVLIAR
jgi:hypothetical protein